jgi:malonyl CoA-acyl carrier protein transacylase/acyl carrier protein
VKQGALFIFAGQGSLLPGWLADYSHIEPLSARLAVADGIARKRGLPSPSSYCFSPHLLDEDEQSAIELLSLFSAQVGIAESLVALGYRPSAITAHSFGEYAAMVASGAIRFDQGFELVRLRECASASRHALGYLIAISGSVEQCAEWLHGIEYEVALVNSPRQTVLAVQWNALIEVERTLKNASCAFIRLSLPQPYHSSWLAETQQRFHSFICQSAIRAEQIRTPLLSSVTSDWVRDPEEVTSLLSQQLIRPVNFVKQLRALSAVTSQYVEIGAKPVLLPFVKQTLEVESKQLISFFDIFGGRKTRETGGIEVPFDHSKQLTKVRAILARLTGFEIESITIEDRIQEDLGIDSLRMMEVLVEAAPEKATDSRTGSFAYPRTVGDLVRLAAGISATESESEVARSEAFEMAERVWLRSDLGDARAKALEASIFSLQEWLDRPVFEKRLVWVIRHSSPAGALDLIRRLRSVLSGKRFSFEFIGFCFDQNNRVEGQPFAALLLSLLKEGGMHSLRVIEYAQLPSQHELLNDLGQEKQFGEVHYAKRDGTARSISVLKPFQAEERLALPDRVLVVGGARGIGFELLDRLSWPSGTQLLIWGRSALSDELTDPLRRWRERGVGVQYARVDLTDAAEVTEQVDSLRTFAQGGTQFHIWNGAGMEMSRAFVQKSDGEVAIEWESKVLATQNLALLCESLRVDRVVQFSSVIREFGNQGQTIYAAANAFAESWLETALSDKVAVSIYQWPPWDSVGMTAKPTVALALKAAGVSLLPAAKAACFFEGELRAPMQKGALRRVSVFDPNDLALYRWPWPMSDRSCAQLGRPMHQNRGIAFAKVFTRSADPFLWDHCIDGKMVLPAAVGIVLLTQTAVASGRQFSAVTNLEIVRRLFTSSDAIGVRVGVDLGKSPPLLTLGNPMTGMRCHFSTAGFAPALSGPDARPRTASWDPSLLYGPKGFFHGPSFQMRESVTQYEGGLYSVPGVPVKAGLEALGFGGVPFALDCVFQLVSLASVTAFSKPALPTGVREAQFLPQAFNEESLKVFVQFRGKLGNHSAVAADAILVAPNGDAVGSLSDIRCDWLPD